MPPRKHKAEVHDGFSKAAPHVQKPLNVPVLDISPVINNWEVSSVF